jgi:uncharacterized membrane protein
MRRTMGRQYGPSMATTSSWTRKFYPREGDGVGFDRVVFFSDAVFAIALTLMAVDIGIPDLEGDQSSPGALWGALHDKGPRLAAYAVAFIWIAVYWRANHRFTSTLRGINSSYLYAVLLFLGFVALLPLPAAMLGEYSTNPLAVSIFALYAAIVSSIEVLLLVTAARGNLFVSPPSPAFLRQQVVGASSPAVVFLISIGIAFWIAPWLAIGFWLVGAIAAGILVSRFLPATPPPDPS